MPSFEVKSIRIIYPDTYVIQEGLKLNSLKTELISGRTQFETGRAPPWHAVLQDMAAPRGRVVLRLLLVRSLYDLYTTVLPFSLTISPSSNLAAVGIRIR